VSKIKNILFLYVIDSKTASGLIYPVYFTLFSNYITHGFFPLKCLYFSHKARKVYSKII